MGLTQKGSHGGVRSGGDGFHGSPIGRIIRIGKRRQTFPGTVRLLLHLLPHHSLLAKGVVQVGDCRLGRLVQGRALGPQLILQLCQVGLSLLLIIGHGLIDLVGRRSDFGVGQVGLLIEILLIPRKADRPGLNRLGRYSPRNRFGRRWRAGTRDRQRT